MTTLPEQLRRSLTWDRGKELSAARRVQGRDRHPGLLRRPAEPLAARHEREHQRAAAPILPQGHRPLAMERRGDRSRRRRAQQQTPQDPRLEDTRRSPRRTPTLAPTSRCCDDRLNPGSTPVICSRTCARHCRSPSRWTSRFRVGQRGGRELQLDSRARAVVPPPLRHQRTGAPRGRRVHRPLQPPSPSQHLRDEATRRVRTDSR